ncbi:MAG: hypothetical protein A2W35_16965 [Chloroflexi bacterium RBG_16_57_11]|nr:MAG: hypothetical protein A2W35_16965 [Chloroflexi bacterium RBG_16_57_11]
MEITQYYNLTFSEVHGGLIVYQDDFKGVDKDLLTKGAPIMDWPSDTTLFVKGRNPTDYLFYPLSPWFTISKKAQIALEDANIKGIQFLPIHVVHKSGIEIPGYAIVNVLTVVAALDYVHTIWMTPDRERVTYPQLNILEEALQKKKVEGFEIFRLVELKTQVYISKYFKECLERKNATVGFDFMPVSAYE